MMAQARSPARIGEPLRLAPVLDPKPWGGRRLAHLGKSLPDGPIGESLESGSDAVVVGGSFAGRTLGDLARAAPDALLGPRGRAAAGALGGFPLLVKLIDAERSLSVQVHPSDADAPAGKRGKTEAWVVLDATPGARVVVGLSGPVALDEIERQLVYEPAVPGDVFLLAAGTVHAIGAGVLLYEIQQASDVTYRLHDWGSDRELHVSEAAAVARTELRALRITRLQLDKHCELLVACRYFAVERWRIDGDATLPARPASCRVVTVVDGAVKLAGVRLPRGTSAILPADLYATQLEGAATLLIGYVPDLDAELVPALRRAGYDAATIAQLGTEVR